MIERDDIYVVPNFISEGYFTRTVIPRELELAGPETHRGTRTIKYCEPVGSHPRMTELLLRRAGEVAPVSTRVRRRCSSSATART
jgi:sirohydrochlorin cobaltochelatase